ncbi:MAG TPA: bacteriohemerythrin [Rhodocyclaceae bacterium]|nr:bacteriohemerythrin [Rhodocyclaceae bacterium]
METIDPKYSIGIEEMDAQHAKLIQIIDRFRSISSDDLREQSSMDITKQSLDALLKYTRFHFASEERLMTTHGYPELESHKQKHRALEATVTKLADEVHASATTTTPMKLNLFLTVWLLEHIKQDDAKYARFILGKP